MEEIKELSETGKVFLWYGLAADTRRNYETAVKSYDYSCKTNGHAPFPASQRGLEEWCTARLMGASGHMMHRVKADTIQAYLASLRSYHVDHNMQTSAFDNPRLAHIIKGARRYFPQHKTTRLPITKDVLTAITSDSTSRRSISNVNVDAAFKVGWADFLRMGEFTNSVADLKNRNFAATGLTRPDVTFGEDGSHVILRLKKSKTDINHTGVEIVSARTDDHTCPVRALRDLFTQDPRTDPNAPLFRFSNGALTRQRTIQILKQRLDHKGISSNHFSGHSFRKGAAQHAADNGMLEEQIKKLGRWTSDAFKLYF